MVADRDSPRDGRFIEKVGTYNPLLKKDDAEPRRSSTPSKADWLNKGAQPTDRVLRFLDKPAWPSAKPATTRRRACRARSASSA